MYQKPSALPWITCGNWVTDRNGVVRSYEATEDGNRYIVRAVNEYETLKAQADEIDSLIELCEHIHHARDMTDWPTLKRTVDSLVHWSSHREFDSYARLTLEGLSSGQHAGTGPTPVSGMTKAPANSKEK